VREQRLPSPDWESFVLVLLGVTLLTVPSVFGDAQPEAQRSASSVPGLVAGSSADQKLRQACAQGDVALLEAAIAEHADVNRALPDSGLPPLQDMLRSAKAPLYPARRECVSRLLAHGAKPDVTDHDGRTAVIYATRLGDLETLRVLVDAEAYVRTRDRFHKTALFYAVESGRRDIASYLAQNGALISLSVKERRQMGQR
jgi:hypothetical protein